MLYLFAGSPSIATVKPGDTVAIYTLDAFENKMTPQVKRFADVCTYPFLNPQTGPILISGAEPGDTLVVKIHEIIPTATTLLPAPSPTLAA